MPNHHNDTKPNMTSSPSPSVATKTDTTRKRAASMTEDVDQKPSPRKRGRPAGHKSKSETKNGRTTGSWKKKEVRELFDAVGIIPATVNWNEVAARVDGRDKLSCSNKWRYDLLPKIQAFIDSLGD